MHISEGVLSAPVLGGGAALAAAGTAIGLSRLNYDRVPQAALLAAAFFLASLIHVPLGPAAVHLVLNGLLGLLLGWAAFPVILIGLTLQAVLFQYGGLTSLGVNTLNMALPAAACWYAFGRTARSSGPTRAAAAGFLAGFGAILGAGLLMALSLALTGKEFLPAAYMILAANLPVMVVEGIITAAAVGFLRKVRPEILEASYAK